MIAKRLLCDHLSQVTILLPRLAPAGRADPRDDANPGGHRASDDAAASRHLRFCICAARDGPCRADRGFCTGLVSSGRTSHPTPLHSY